MKSKLVLLVEDENYKLSHIKQLVIDTFQCRFGTAKSVKSALDSIDDESPSLILLDMSLPTYEVVDRERGGRPQGYGGREVLRFLQMEELFIPTIVITGYDAFPDASGSVGLKTLKSELCREFPNILEAVLRYDSTSSSWRDELIDTIFNLDILEQK